MRALLLKLFGPVVRPIFWFLLRFIDVEDPWEQTGNYVPVHAFGQGSQRNFEWYLQGDSQVVVGSVQEVCTWLLNCHYKGDPELFHEPDFWQHPKTFEHLRQGDCEDFALWAWRKLIELDIDAHLFVGHLSSSGPTTAHAWVVFHNKEGSFLMEPAARARSAMIRPFTDIKKEYAPHVSVDRHGKRQSYAGYLLAWKARRNRSTPQAA